MSSVSQRIPNLLGGVSQQPDSLKLPGQMRVATNCLPDPTYGMRKRPGLKLISALSGAVDEGRWFSIFRDASEKYIGQFKADGTMLIWDALTGASKTVNAIATSAKNYIANCSAADFEMLQINDYNFVLNRSKTVGKLATTSAPKPPTAVVTVNLLGYDAKYGVKVDTFTADHTTPATGTLDVSVVVSDLATKIAALDGGGKYSTIIAGTTIVVQRVNGADFKIESFGGVNSQALLVYKDSVPNVSRLPSQCQNGVVLKVANLEEAEGDDYYVEFKVNQSGSSVGSGVWEETIKPNSQLYIDPDTMPHVIIRESDGTFTFRSLNEAQKAADDLYWVERRVGDDETNPFPSFVTKKITGISFFRNRLVLLAGSTVVCSQPGNYFNLFRVSALAQTDGDGVDISTGSLKPVDLRYALGDQLGLLLFSATTQFMLTSEADQFGPVSAQVKQFSNFNMDPAVRPVETGLSYVFTTKNQNYAQVTEMVASSVENRPSIAELSRTAPQYVPSNLQSIVASQSASMLSFLSATNRKDLKVFKFFNNSGERVLASWLAWTLPGDCLLQTADSDQLYIVTKQQNGICLSVVSLISDLDGTAVSGSGLPYEYRLDLFTSTPLLEYDSVNNWTRCYFKANSYDSTLAPVAVVDDSASERGSIYTGLPVQLDGTGYHVRLPGDRTGATNVVLGYSYEFRLELPVFYVKSSTQSGQTQADVSNIPRVTRMVIQANDSGPYTATVKLLGRPDKTYSFEQTPANSYLANEAPLPDLIDNVVPIYGKGTDALVSLYSLTPFPLALVAATWYGVYANRGIRQI